MRSMEQEPPQGSPLDDGQLLQLARDRAARLAEETRREAAELSQPCRAIDPASLSQGADVIGRVADIASRLAESLARACERDDDHHLPMQSS